MVARGTGQYINILGFVLNALTWLQDAPSGTNCLICIIIYTLAMPINYLPVRDPTDFVNTIYRPITRTCACFIGLMPEKHVLFAALHQACLAVAAHGSSLSPSESLIYLLIVCATQVMCC
jgi:hypothetical protein